MTMPVRKVHGDYFLPETAARVEKMLLGNGYDTARDLGMRKKEFWETRPYPAKLHHWMADEFRAFLYEHRYPGNTIEDRMRFHTQSIRDALVRGEPVPKNVFESPEGVYALDDALIHVKGDDGWAFNAARDRYLQELFRDSVAKRRASIAQVDPLEELFMKAVKLCAEKEVSVSPDFTVDWHERPLRVFQLDDPKLFRVQDADFHQGELFGGLENIKREDAESWAAKAMEKGDVSYDDVCWLVRDRSVDPRVWYPRSSVDVTVSYPRQR